MNYSRRIIDFLCVNCIYIYLLDIFDSDPTQPDSPKTETFVIQPDPTRHMDESDPTLWDVDQYG